MNAQQSILRQKVGQAAVDYLEHYLDNQLEHEAIIGIGTGNTVEYFIDALSKSSYKNSGKIAGVVPSSEKTKKQLKAAGFTVVDMNAGPIALYIDSADECTPNRQLVKGGGGALTREKIVAAASERFLCIIDEAKYVKMLGAFPLAIELIPMARSYVAREIVKLGGSPTLRENFITDNGNQIIDVYHLDLSEPIKMEQIINNITGVVCNGIFAVKPADEVLIATPSEIIHLKSRQKSIHFQPPIRPCGPPSPPANSSPATYVS